MTIEGSNGSMGAGRSSQSIIVGSRINSMYCIYTDKDVPEDQGNFDHIIPLALGGLDEFVTWSEEAINSTMGSKIDGALHRDPFIQFALRENGVTGHSRTPVEPRWRKVTMDGKPIQITWGKEKVTFWDSRERKELGEEEVAGKELQVELKIDAYLAFKFIAKVALGGGYFVYGDDFKQAVNCDVLRRIVTKSIEELRSDALVRSYQMSVCDRFHANGMPGGKAFHYRLLCESIDRSLFITVPHDNGISFHVGVAGRYIGSIIMAGDGTNLPLGGEHDLGHAVVLAPGTLERVSFRELLQDFWRAATGEEPPPIPT